MLAVERLIVGAVLLAAAALVAVLLQRRERPAPAPTGWTVPASVDRQDFVDPSAPWLVAVFTSATCDACAGVWAKARPLGSDAVAVQEVEVGRDKALHDRYGIDAVPTTVICDAEGIVAASYVGPVTATDLWATVAELREPGSVPPGCDHDGNHTCTSGQH